MIAGSYGRSASVADTSTPPSSGGAGRTGDVSRRPTPDGQQRHAFVDIGAQVDDTHAMRPDTQHQTTATDGRSVNGRSGVEQGGQQHPAALYDTSQTAGRRRRHLAAAVTAHCLPGSDGVQTGRHDACHAPISPQ